MSPRYAARTDGNQNEIIAALRGVGAHVQPIHRLGQGVPDLLVSFRMRWHVLEVKAPGGKLTADELAFVQAARAEVHVVDSVEKALEAIGAAVAVAGGAIPTMTKES